ncbi:hypothetical protein BJ508DRAFT_341742, partial [Ascobolus immersus RN42]
MSTTFRDNGTVERDGDKHATNGKQYRFNMDPDGVCFTFETDNEEEDEAPATMEHHGSGRGSGNEPFLTLKPALIDEHEVEWMRRELKALYDENTDLRSKWGSSEKRVHELEEKGKLLKEQLEALDTLLTSYKERVHELEESEKLLKEQLEALNSRSTSKLVDEDMQREKHCTGISSIDTAAEVGPASQHSQASQQPTPPGSVSPLSLSTTSSPFAPQSLPKPPSPPNPSSAYPSAAYPSSAYP